MQALFAFKDGAHMKLPILTLVETCIRQHPEDGSRDIVFEFAGRRESDRMPVYQEVRDCTPIPIFRHRKH